MTFAIGVLILLAGFTGFILILYDQNLSKMVIWIFAAVLVIALTLYGGYSIIRVQSRSHPMDQNR